jgi:hypothetical protein
MGMRVGGAGHYTVWPALTLEPMMAKRPLSAIRVVAPLALDMLEPAAVVRVPWVLVLLAAYPSA